MEYSDLALQSEQLRKALRFLTDEAERIYYRHEDEPVLKQAIDQANDALTTAVPFRFECTPVEPSPPPAAGRQEAP